MCLRPLILEVVRLIKNDFEFIIQCISSDERTLKRVEYARFMREVGGEIMREIMSEIRLEYREKYRKILQERIRELNNKK